MYFIHEVNARVFRETCSLFRKIGSSVVGRDLRRKSADSRAVRLMEFPSRYLLAGEAKLTDFS